MLKANMKDDPYRLGYRAGIQCALWYVARYSLKEVQKGLLQLEKDCSIRGEKPCRPLAKLKGVISRQSSA